MPNPYHDELGQFSSKNGMVAALDRVAQNGDMNSYLELRESLENIQTPEAVRREKFAREFKVKLDRKAAMDSQDVEKLREFETHEDSVVRKLTAQNPHTPVEVLDRMSRDKDRIIRTAVAGNSSTSPKTLTRLAKDSNSYIRERATTNPSFQ